MSLQRVLATLLTAAIVRGLPLASQTARCSDGTLSYSAHRSGTCSHHGGVAEWLAPAQAPGQQPTRAADTSRGAQNAAPWVASSRGHTYYRRGCSTANRLSPANLIYFRSEADAQKAGYHRSRSKGC